MIFRPTRLAGCFVVIPEAHTDERGFFARTYSRADFEAAGLESTVSECSISYNERKGTLRGMHYQVAPHEEVKLVRCTKGRVFDVAVDLRRGSPTYRSWDSVILSAENRWSLFIPKGFAHGFLTLEEDTEIAYQISTPYVRQHARGFRWDDPAVGIEWPDAGPRTIAEQDRGWPELIPGGGPR